jgi:hypothetical protein
MTNEEMRREFEKALAAFDKHVPNPERRGMFLILIDEKEVDGKLELSTTVSGNNCGPQSIMECLIHTIIDTKGMAGFNEVLYKAMSNAIPAFREMQRKFDQLGAALFGSDQEKQEKPKAKPAVQSDALPSEPPSFN